MKFSAKSEFVWSRIISFKSSFPRSLLNEASVDGISFANLFFEKGMSAHFDARHNALDGNIVTIHADVRDNNFEALDLRLLGSADLRARGCAPQSWSEAVRMHRIGEVDGFICR